MQQRLSLSLTVLNAVKRSHVVDDVRNLQVIMSVLNAVSPDLKKEESLNG